MFNDFNIDKKTLLIIIVIMLVFGGARYLSNPNAILWLLYSVPGVLIAITFHEFAHAKTADILGDDTPRIEGRISLNPLAHIDPIGSIMLLFAGFGWGKPVHVNPRNYNRTMSMEKADAIVSIAGPVTNFILAIVFTIVYFLIYKYTKNTQSTAFLVISAMINRFIVINVGLGVFNLIPLPPLDGSKVIKPFLPYNAKLWFESNESIFYIIFVVLWITGIAGIIISPVVNWVDQGIYNLVSLIIR